MDGYKRLGREVRRARLELGIGYREAARRAKIGEQTWLNVEHGRSVPRDGTIQRVVKFLRWDPSYVDAIVFSGEDVEARLVKLEVAVREIEAMLLTAVDRLGLFSETEMKKLRRDAASARRVPG